MQCPYCVEEIADAAIVCPYCRHDLAPSRALIDENKTLRDEIAALRAELAVARTQNARALADAQVVVRHQRAPIQSLISELVSFGFVPIALLLFAHFLIILVWDAPTVYLRIVSIIVPMPFGAALIFRERRSLGWAAAIGAAVSVLSIFGMSVAVAMHDNVPVLPSNAQEWNEDFQYFLSIALAFITGGLLARLVRGTTQQLATASTRTDKLTAKIAPLLAPKGRKLLKGKNAKTLMMIERALGVQKVVTGVVAAATTAGSIYTGVMSVLH
jgi:hypothetical protein